ncbi:MAG: hypothetical protein LBD49_01905, partial [Oscillospiraceae bacterium]|nr:hypothetical protein [Oscillospiraceae bacterium]
MRRRGIAAVLLALAMALSAPGCVNQHPAPEAPGAGAAPESAAPSGDAEEGGGAYRLIATSRAAVEICGRLGLRLVGRPALDGLPERYDGLPET